MSSPSEYDAIVIGSGIGGLAFASIMAKLRSWRVLVLERHFKIGGFTHTFTRPGGWSWDVGLHYVGEMGEGMVGRLLFDFITDRGVTWNPMPDVYDVFVYPNLQVKACKGKANFRTVLIDAFPKEQANIEQYFRDLKSAIRWFNRHVMALATPAPLSNLVRAVNRLSAGLPLEVTRHYLERRFRDQRARLFRLLDLEIAQNEKLFQLFLVDLRRHIRVRFQNDRCLQRIADQFVLTRFFDRLADHATQFQELGDLLARAKISLWMLQRKFLQMN